MNIAKITPVIFKDKIVIATLNQVLKFMIE